MLRYNRKWFIPSWKHPFDHGNALLKNVISVIFKFLLFLKAVLKNIAYVKISKKLFKDYTSLQKNVFIIILSTGQGAFL